MAEYKQIEESFYSNISESLNGYNLSRKWFNFRYDNPHKCKSVHSELFLYIVDVWNRLGQKDVFGLPTLNTMELLNIGSRNTYYKVLKDLEDFGFIKTIKESKNQYQSRIIAISKNEQASKQALDQALIQASEQTPEHIDKQRNKETKNNIISFEEFWNIYDKKVDKVKCKKKFSKLTEKELTQIKETIKQYIKVNDNKKYRKNPLTYLNGKCWEDEIEEKPKPTAASVKYLNYTQ